MAAVKSPRRLARESALQALYAWQIAGATAGDLVEQMRALEGHEKADAKLAEALVRGVLEREGELRPLIGEFIDRSFESLSPVERGILYIGAFELSALPDTPFKVVLNEAIELGKSFGGTGGHKFVNGVLEKLATRLRPAEVAAGRRPATA
jgi:N utilization substance protein B